MAEIKFSCGQCGQHISADRQWSGQQIQCPSCQGTLTVPITEAAFTQAGPNPNPPRDNRPKLSAGLTQVARSAPTTPIPQRRNTARPPKTTNPAVKYAVSAMVVLIITLAGLKYLPSLLNQAQEISPIKSSGSMTAPASGGGGPLGEVNGAMDVSDALDGSGPSKPRPGSARRPVAAPVPAALATNSNAQVKTLPSSQRPATK
jgi:hypothetical protein